MLSIQIRQAKYGDQPVLHEIDLSLVRGELLGLIGPNGSGKTSLLRCITGPLPAWQGEIQLAGNDVQRMSARERARHFAVVPQSAHLPPAFTVWESVSLGRTPHLNWLGQLGEKDRQRIDWALDATQLVDLKARRVGKLSGGEQQRVLLARALAQEAPVLLLDEPTAHLDLHHQVAFLGLVKRLAEEENLAVLIALHDLNLASIYADRLMLLVAGRTLASGTPREVLNTENLLAAYQTPLSVGSHAANGRPFIFIDPSKVH